MTTRAFSLLLVAGLLLVVAGCSPEATPTPTETPTRSVAPSSPSPEPRPSEEPTTQEPSPEPTPTSTLNEQQTSAVETLEVFFSEYMKLLGDVDAQPQALVDVSTGNAQQFALDDVVQMRNLGWVAVGDSVRTIQEVGPVTESEAEPIVEIRMCEDLTGVEIVDHDTGEPVDHDPTTFTTWDSTLIEQDGRWLVSDVLNTQVEGCYAP